MNFFQKLAGILFLALESLGPGSLVWKRANNWISGIKEGKRAVDVGGEAELPPFPSPQALLG